MLRPPRGNWKDEVQIPKDEFESMAGLRPQACVAYSTVHAVCGVAAKLYK